MLQQQYKLWTFPFTDYIKFNFYLRIKTHWMKDLKEVKWDMSWGSVMVHLDFVWEVTA